MKRMHTDTIDLSDEALQDVSLTNKFEERSEVAQEIISRRPDFFENRLRLMAILFLYSPFSKTSTLNKVNCWGM